MPTLKTGDLVLFSGRGARSTLIKRCTGCLWSHVGMVIRENNDTHLYESTSVGVLPDLDTGIVVNGVQTVSLHDRISQYPGPVSLRSLDQAPSPDMLVALSTMRRELRGRPYEVNHFELLMAAYDGPLGACKLDTSSIFCSELVALAYQAMGYLGHSVPANEYTPRDFSDMGKLSLKKGRLSKEVIIKE